jgi:hypothetical protein
MTPGYLKQIGLVDQLATDDKGLINQQMKELGPASVLLGVQRAWENIDTGLDKAGDALYQHFADLQKVKRKNAEDNEERNAALRGDRVDIWGYPKPDRFPVPATSVTVGDIHVTLSTDSRDPQVHGKLVANEVQNQLRAAKAALPRKTSE